MLQAEDHIASEIPTDRVSLRIYAKAFLDRGRFDEATAIITILATIERAAEHGPAHPRRVAELWSELAMIVAGGNHAPFVASLAEAERRFAPHAFAVPAILDAAADPAAARVALQELVDRDPADLPAREALVRALVRCDFVDEAERQIATHLVGVSAAATLEALRALVAMRRQDWDAARVAWTGYARHRPDDLAVASAIDRVNLVQQLAEAETTNGAARPVPVAPGYCYEPVTRRLLLRFESIGGDCDFGTVQRRYGAEPLGLLRWAQTDIPQLMSMLEGRLEGIGEPANTVLVVGPEGHILLEDARWRLTMHTFLFEREVSLAALHPKMCRRTAYLRDKFLDDLRDAAKTLVFNSDEADRRDLVALHERLCTFGPVRLLNVRGAAASRGFARGRPGSVTELAPGLFVGRVDRKRYAPPPFHQWVELCHGVERLIDDAPNDPCRIAGYARVDRTIVERTASAGC